VISEKIKEVPGVLSVLQSDYVGMWEDSAGNKQSNMGRLERSSFGLYRLLPSSVRRKISPLIRKFLGFEKRTHQTKLTEFYKSCHSIPVSKRNVSEK
jgi:hypothetical protein